MKQVIGSPLTHALVTISWQQYTGIHGKNSYSSGSFSKSKTPKASPWFEVFDADHTCVHTLGSTHLPIPSPLSPGLMIALNPVLKTKFSCLLHSEQKRSFITKAAPMQTVWCDSPQAVRNQQLTAKQLAKAAAAWNMMLIYWCGVSNKCRDRRNIYLTDSNQTTAKICFEKSILIKIKFQLCGRQKKLKLSGRWIARGTQGEVHCLQVKSNFKCV